MQDGEMEEDESMRAAQEEAERRRPLFRMSKNGPSSQEVQEHMKTHCSTAHGVFTVSEEKERNVPHRSVGGRRGPMDHLHLAVDYGFPKANKPDDLEDQ